MLFIGYVLALIFICIFIKTHLIISKIQSKISMIVNKITILGHLKIILLSINTYFFGCSFNVNKFKICVYYLALYVWIVWCSYFEKHH